jgi:hydroxymethylbilane synthase
MASAPRELRLGTRGSQLALWQAHAVAARIAENGGPGCRIVIIRTTGDRLQEAALSEVGGKRLFVKEIEDALLRRDIDLGVHSSKDMPAILPDGLTIAGVLPREDPLDAVVLPASRVRLKPDTSYDVRPETTSGLKRDASQGLEEAATDGNPDTTSATDSGTSSYVVSGVSRTYPGLEALIAALGQSPLVGTGSVRRVAQLTRLLPRARFDAIRGNLDTRLRKLDEGHYDALVLAAAGLRRLGFASRISLALPPKACVPAPGQGIVAIEIREDNDDVRRIVTAIDDAETAAALNAERALVAALGGGCQTPIGALASTTSSDEIELIAAVVSLDGGRAVRGHGRGARCEAATLGMRVGAQLIADGADQILAEARTGR